MNHNLSSLTTTCSSIDQEKFDVVLLSEDLKDESWKAFSDGGELQWINDPGLLSILSDAYYEIRVIASLSKKYFELTQFAGNNTTKYMVDFIDTSFKRSIDNGIKSIDNALISIKN